jgi:hypothetical protein
MKDVTLYPFNTNSLVWEKIENDLAKDDVLDYEVVIPEGGKDIVLTIDVDLGGGFEGGFASTTLSAMLPHDTDFRFAIHKEDFIDEIGKFFGMQDVKIGFYEFDKKMIVKTNDERKVTNLFSDLRVQQDLLSLKDFSFGIHSHHVSNTKQPFLELVIDDAVTDISDLKKLYNAFYAVLLHLEEQSKDADSSTSGSGF